MIDFNKPVQTKTGEPVIIYTTFHPGPAGPIVGAYLDSTTGEWEVEHWYEDGSYWPTGSGPTAMDLENVPGGKDNTVWKEVWVNLLDYGEHYGVAGYGSLLMAKYHTQGNMGRVIARSKVMVLFEIGKFDNEDS